MLQCMTKETDERRICTLEYRIGIIRVAIRQFICDSLSVCGPGICTCLLDQRTALGCMACSMEFCADAGTWKAALYGIN